MATVKQVSEAFQRVTLESLTEEQRAAVQELMAWIAEKKLERAAFALLLERYPELMRDSLKLTMEVFEECGVIKK